MSGISKKYYGAASKWPTLHSHNPKVKNPQRIYPGDKLYLGLRDGAYVEGGLSYFRNTTSGQANQILIEQVPGTSYHSVFYRNNAHADGPGLNLGGGYQWIMTPHWSWSIGGQISYYSIAQKGYYNVYNALSNYTYDVSALVVNAVVRLYWHATSRNTLYGEVTSGIANLRSQDFHLTDPSGTVEHDDKMKNNFDYGIAIGWLYHFNFHTSFKIAFGYQDLGKAVLGTRIVPQGVTSKGEITQKLRGFNATVGLVHWF